MAKNERKTVLITRFSALGDVAMSIPVVYDICRAYPDTRFVMVTKSTVAGIFVNPPDNLTVEGVDLKRRYTGPHGLLRLFRHLYASYRFGTLVDLHDVTRTKVLRAFAWAMGVSVSSIDKKRHERRRLLHHAPGSSLQPLETSFDRYRNAFRAAGFTAAPQFRSVFGETLPDVSEIAGNKATGERWIAVAPFAAHHGKIYPEALMREVIAALAGRQDTRLFLFGAGEKESAAIDRMTEGIGNTVSMARLGLGFARELEVLSHMDAAVTMDSGNMHLASLTGIPVVSVWGQTHPACGFTGWRQDPDNAIGSDTPCRPCSIFGNRECRFGDYRCLTAIDPQSIVRRVGQLTTNDLKANEQ